MKIVKVFRINWNCDKEKSPLDLVINVFNQLINFISYLLIINFLLKYLIKQNKIKTLILFIPRSKFM